ncbi:MAG: GTPase [Planctomycetota bacterium]
MPRVELLTPRGEAALAVVRVSGPGAPALLAELGIAEVPPPASLAVRRLRIGAGPGEQAVVVGTEDGTELQVHGSPLLVARLLAHDDGGPPAPVGLRQRLLDLACRAPGREGLALCLRQLEPDGLLGIVRRAAADGPGPAILAELRPLVAGGDLHRHLMRRATVALRGPVNAGKSTLANLCAGRPRVVTGPTPGLTRDPVAVDLVHRGWPLRILDTAGEGATDDELDREAAALARLAADRADLVVRVEPRRGTPAGAGAEQARLRVLTEAPAPRGAVPPIPGPADLRVDLVAEGAAAEAVRERVLDAVLVALGRPSVPPPPAPAWLEPDQRDALLALADAAEDRVRWSRIARSLLDGRSPG